MGAIANNYDPKEAAFLALKAGTDVVIYSSSKIDELANTIDHIESNIGLFTESQNRIRASKAVIKRHNISASSCLETLKNSPLKMLLEKDQ